MSSDRFAKAIETEQDIIDYLLAEWEVSEVRAKEIVSQANIRERIAEAKRLGSFIYFVGTEIAEACGLEEKELNDEDIAYESDDT